MIFLFIITTLAAIFLAVGILTAVDYSDNKKSSTIICTFSEIKELIRKFTLEADYIIGNNQYINHDHDYVTIEKLGKRLTITPINFEVVGQYLMPTFQSFLLYKFLVKKTVRSLVKQELKQRKTNILNSINNNNSSSEPITLEEKKDIILHIWYGKSYTKKNIDNQNTDHPEPVDSDADDISDFSGFKILK